jgi:hypothetical protein
MNARATSRALLFAVALGAVLGCSDVLPKVGDEQRVCKIYITACELPAPGGACDECESVYCCGERKACYDDPACGCADVATDVCLEPTDGSVDDPAVVACWSAFAGSSVVAQNRVACELQYCQSVCQVPAGALGAADAGAPVEASASDAGPAEAGDD